VFSFVRVCCGAAVDGVGAGKVTEARESLIGAAVDMLAYYRNNFATSQMREGKQVSYVDSIILTSMQCVLSMVDCGLGFSPLAPPCLTSSFAFVFLNVLHRTCVYVRCTVDCPRQSQAASSLYLWAAETCMWQCHVRVFRVNVCQMGFVLMALGMLLVLSS
jgi:hypothetical protein